MKEIYIISGLILGLMPVWTQDTVTARGSWDMVVAEDGSCDFTTIQEAIDAVPHLRNNRTTIFIRAGTYREKLILPSTKTNVSLVASADRSRGGAIPDHQYSG